MHRGDFVVLRRVFIFSYTIAKKKNRNKYERVRVCIYVRGTLTLQQVSFLILEGMIMPFLAMRTAVKANEVRTRRNPTTSLY